MNSHSHAARAGDWCAFSRIEAWQEAFFASVFSHYNESTPFKGAEAYEVLAAMVKRPPKTFPSKFFIPMREKLGQAVQRVSEKQ